VFGPENFRTEIVWKRSAAHSDTKQGRQQHGRVHDTLFFYTKGSTWTWNPIYVPHDPSYIESHYKSVEPESGRRYQLTDITGPGGAAKGNPSYEVMGVTKYWRYSRKRMQELIDEGRIVQPRPGAVPRYKRYLDEMPGNALQDIWTDIDPVNSQAKERLPYPTQKPLALMERIILSSSNPGDLVLDPFCGCGTTVDAAQATGRKWIGIDITHKGIDVIRERLARVYGDEIENSYKVHWEPVSLDDAAALAERPLDFQDWVIRRLGATGSRKRGADKGIDGRIYFHDEPDGPTRQVIVSVKAGHTGPTHVRDLRGVLEREKADIGVLVTLREPTINMRREASSAGDYISVVWDEKHPRIQLLTAEALLSGKGVRYPRGDKLVGRMALDPSAALIPPELRELPESEREESPKPG
jgi:hypothetical protein